MNIKCSIPNDGALYFLLLQAIKIPPQIFMLQSGLETDIKYISF